MLDKPVGPIDPNEIVGVEPLSRPDKIEREDTQRLCLTAEFTLASAAQLVALIHDENQLLFYDDDHPQRSDPGLYCYLQRHDGTLYAQGANHGWSYPRLIISDIDAARWIWLCAKYNNGADTYEASVMNIRTAPPLSEDDRAPRSPYSEQFQKWLVTRLS